jgi:hypothetical protein
MGRDGGGPWAGREKGEVVVVEGRIEVFFLVILLPIIK